MVSDVPLGYFMADEDRQRAVFFWRRSAMVLFGSVVERNIVIVYCLCHFIVYTCTVC